jgi:glucose/arabinose dehydrogenase
VKHVLRLLAAAASATIAGLGIPAAADALVLTPVDTFTAPIHAAAPPGDGRRLMVVERGGAVRVVRDGTTLPTPFLDVRSAVDAAGEGGLLSIAFAPDYVTSGRFYVFLTPTDADPGAAPHAPIEVREYRRAAGNPERADPASGRTVLQIPHPDFGNHYGGGLQFGPDGLLYVATGDGGGAGDPNGNAQNTSRRLGKLLRIDPRRNGTAPFTVPQDNPFVAAAGDELVWSYGLRNPFRFSFDRASGDLTIGDVGQSAVEEVDFARSADGGGRGVNFGWNRCEGPLAYPITEAKDPCTFAAVTGPVISYEASEPCNSITGGVVVRDPGLEELAGRYLYGDYCQGFVRHAQLATPTATDDDDTGLSAPNAVAFGEDACGRVHVVRLSGPVSRLEDDSPLPCELRVSYPTSSARAPALPPPWRPAAATPPAALRVLLGGTKRQRTLRRRAVLVRVRCSTTCRVRARGTLSLRGADGRRLRVLGTVRVLVSDERAMLRLRLSRRTRAAVARRLRLGRRVTAALTIGARGLSGELTERTRSVRIVL